MHTSVITDRSPCGFKHSKMELKMEEFVITKGTLQGIQEAWGNSKNAKLQKKGELPEGAEAPLL